MEGTGVYYHGKLEAWFIDRLEARDFAQAFLEKEQKFIEIKATEIQIPSMSFVIAKEAGKSNN